MSLLSSRPLILVLVFGLTLADAIASSFAPVPLGLPPIPGLDDTQEKRNKVLLGSKLFNDKRFSADGTIGCVSCHQPKRAFTDGRPVASGIHDRKGTRNTPTLLNIAYLESQFWDGRSRSLEDQAGFPFVNPFEHGLESHNAVLRQIRRSRAYVSAFRAVYGIEPRQITMQHVVSALATFQRTLLAGDSPFDRFYYGNDRRALSPAAARGLDVFRGKGDCATCHTIGVKAAIFTDQQFHGLGVGREHIASRLAHVAKQAVVASATEAERLIVSRPDIAALGRFLATRKPADIGKFRTPSLRNVALTAPYMHDGSVATLEEAIDLEIYYRGIAANRPLVLTPEEKSDLVDFLKSLTSAGRTIEAERESARRYLK